MTVTFSYAVVLHRVFDSAPPENEPVFCAGGRPLTPQRKAMGLYVFTSQPDQLLTVNCGGYQPEQIAAKQGGCYHICLYPSIAYQPPLGWGVTLGCAPPGELCFWPDEGCAVRLLAFDLHAFTARLRSKPGFVGGCLRFTGAAGSSIALVLEKQPPDLFYLSPLAGGYSGGTVQKGYAARADTAGTYAVAAPLCFEITPIGKDGDAL